MDAVGRKILGHSLHSVWTKTSIHHQHYQCQCFLGIFFQRSQELSTEHMVKLKLQCSMTELLSTVMLCLQGPSANAKIPISDLRYSPPQSIYTIRQYQLTCTAKPWHLHVYIYFLFHFFH